MRSSAAIWRKRIVITARSPAAVQQTEQSHFGHKFAIANIKLEQPNWACLTLERRPKSFIVAVIFNVEGTSKLLRSPLRAWTVTTAATHKFGTWSSHDARCCLARILRKIHGPLNRYDRFAQILRNTFTFLPMLTNVWHELDDRLVQSTVPLFRDITLTLDGTTSHYSVT
jgi:hypothetical protein